MAQSSLNSWLERFRRGLGLAALVPNKVLPRFVTKLLLLHFYKIWLDVENGMKDGEVSICRYKHGANGALCISIDFEKPLHQQRKRAKISREAVSQILQLSEHHEIPITWGICGNLTVGKSVYKDSFEEIMTSKVQHDIGSHSFSHKDFSKCLYDDAKSDLMKSIEVLRESRRPTTFIFPFNKEGQLTLLRELEFTAYRGVEKKLTYPSRTHGLWNINQTCFFGGMSSDVAAYDLLLRLLQLTNLAIRYGCVFHIWSHPWSMSMSGSAKRFAEKVLRPLFGYAEKKRGEKLLWICTMRQLANYCEARRNCIIEEHAKQGNEIRVRVRCHIEDARFDFPPEVTAKIRLPHRTRVSKVFLDEEEIQFDKFCYIMEKRKRFLILTLQFEKPIKVIRILTCE